MSNERVAHYLEQAAFDIELAIAVSKDESISGLADLELIHAELKQLAIRYEMQDRGA